jgi:phosphoribosyl-ATP pyrophosphohydrolase/phosphoribosyl-AMP cyclohydrolase
MDIDFKKGGGLVPAIVQDARTEQVLMLGYMNADSLAKTQETGLVTFWSRSRNELWTKGETSGNTLALESVDVDCDNDTLLVRAVPNGPTCHLGTTSCFGDKGPQGLGFLSYLEDLIEARKTADKDSSYTASLLQGPLRRAAQKVGEEGVETALAAVAETDDKLVSESADLVYHLMVLLAAKDVKLADVINELRGRHR